MFIRKKVKPKKRELPRKASGKSSQKSLFLRIIFYFLFIVFCGIVIFVLFFSPFLKINKLILSGTQELSYTDVMGYTKTELAGNYLKILPRGNFIIFSKSKLKSRLSDEFKKIEIVKVEKIFPDTLKIDIIERRALILWCSKGPCYIIDAKGYAYSGIDVDSTYATENNLVKLIDVGSKPVNLGEKVLDENYVSFVKDIKSEFESGLGITLGDDFYTQSRLAGEVRMTTSQGWMIYLNSEIPLDKSIRTLKTFLEKELPAGQGNNIEYVDLRAEDKIYYKLKTGEVINSPASAPEQPAVPVTKTESKDKKKK